MKNLLKLIFRVLSRANNHSELSNIINDKIDGFLKEFFPREPDMLLGGKQIAKALPKLEEINKLVLNVSCFSAPERRDVEFLSKKLYSDLSKNVDKEARLSKKKILKIMKELNIVRSIVIHRLKRKHREVSKAAKSIRQQAKFIRDFYLPRGIQLTKNQAAEMISNFRQLDYYGKEFNKVTQNAGVEYQEISRKIKELLNSLMELIKYHREEGEHIVFEKKEGIVIKLIDLMHSAKV